MVVRAYIEGIADWRACLPSSWTQLSVAVAVFLIPSVTESPPYSDESSLLYWSARQALAQILSRVEAPLHAATRLYALAFWAELP